MEQRSSVKRYLAHPAFAVAALDTWFRHYDRATPDPTSSSTATDRSASGPTRSCRTPIRTPTSAAGRCASRPQPASTRALAVTVLQNAARRRSSVRAAAVAVARTLPRDRRPRSCSAPTSQAVEVDRRPRRSPGRSTATTSVRSTDLDIALRRRLPHPRRALIGPPSARTPAARRRARR